MVKKFKNFFGGKVQNVSNEFDSGTAEKVPKVI